MLLFFFASSNILILPLQFWQIGFEKLLIAMFKVPNTGAFTVKVYLWTCRHDSSENFPLENFYSSYINTSLKAWKNILYDNSGTCLSGFSEADLKIKTKITLATHSIISCHMINLVFLWHQEVVAREFCSLVICPHFKSLLLHDNACRF